MTGAVALTPAHLAFLGRRVIFPWPMIDRFRQGGPAMIRLLTATLVMAGFCAAALPAGAQEPANPKPLGTWVRWANGCKSVIEIKPDRLHYALYSKEEGFTLSTNADYLVTRDGMLIGAIRMHKGAKQEKDKDPLEGRLFMCHFSLDTDSLIISQLEELKTTTKWTSNVNEFIEGKYHRVQGKNDLSQGKGAPERSEAKQAKCDQSPSPKSSAERRNTASSDPNRRMRDLLNASEQSGPLEYDWKSIWIFDEPSQLTPERVHGGIQ
jgi:hypothetical protein